MTNFELFVDDNYHYMDEESRYKVGAFASYSEALARAKAIVDEFLENSHEPGMTSKELFEGYVGFGEDPFIVPRGEPYFSAWEYARSRCLELCRDEDTIASVLRYPAWPAELRFRDSGQRDRRVGDPVSAFEAMRQAALDEVFALRASS
jgi:hypothetical protein